MSAADSSVAARPADVPVVLALGANLGDPLETLAEAVAQLSDRLEATALSPLARTEPVGGPEQPAYLNAVLLARTGLAPDQVLALAHEVEAAAGRQRLERWGPRTLDVDVIQYGVGATAVRSADPGLTLPHPRAAERAFVLWPWAQADPGAVLVTADGEAQSVADLAERATDRAGLTPGPAWPPGTRAAQLAALGRGGPR